MSNNDDIKKELESAEAAAEDAADTAADAVSDAADAVKDTAEDASDALSDTAAALKEYAEDEAASKDEDKAPKKKKRQRTPEEEKERALNSVKRRKKLKYGALATIITVVVIAIVVVVNIICGLLDQRFNWNIDLTSSGLYEIDEKTVEYLHQLNSDVKITMLADESYFLENNMLKVAAETLNRFKTESNGHISVEYVDANKNPEAISVYKQNFNGDFSTGDAVVSCGDLVRVVGFMNNPYAAESGNTLFKTEQSFDQTTYTSETHYKFVGEQALVSAIMGVTDLNPVTVAMIDKVNGSPIYDNRDAYCYQAIKEALDKNNYKVESVDIATAELTADYDIIMLCSPSNDLTEAQITKISDYLNNDSKYGRKMIYFGSPFKSANTENLDEFLSVWGVKIGRSYATETNSGAAQVANIAIGTIGGVPVVTANAEASLNAGFTASRLPIITPLCCPVERLYDQNSGRYTYPLLTTSDSCVLYPLDESAEDFNADSAEKVSADMAVLSEVTFTSGSETLKSQIAVFGSPWIMDIVVAGSSGSYDNANYFISLLNTATGKENVITIAEKSLDKAKMTITDSQAKTIRAVTLFAIPLLVAVIGIVVYVRRRNK